MILFYSISVLVSFTLLTGRDAGLNTLQQATAHAVTRLKPHAEEAWAAVRTWTDPAWQHATPHIDSATRWIDARFAGLLPWQVAAMTSIAVLLLVWVLHWVYRGTTDLKEAGKKLFTTSCGSYCFSLVISSWLDTCRLIMCCADV